MTNVRIAMFTLVILMAGLGVACVSPRSQPRPLADASPSLDSFLKVQNSCFSQWNSILDDWLSQGGGLRATVQAAREAIRKDGDSRFATIIRSSWDKQDKISSTNGPSDGEVALAFTGAAKGYVTDECRSPIWIEQLILEREDVFYRQSLSDIADELQIDFGSEPRKLAHKIAYMLLSRRDPNVKQ